MDAIAREDSRAKKVIRSALFGPWMIQRIRFTRSDPFISQLEEESSFEAGHDLRIPDFFEGCHNLQYFQCEPLCSNLDVDSVSAELSYRTLHCITQLKVLQITFEDNIELHFHLLYAASRIWRF